jgi:hypothetical protein
MSQLIRPAVVCGPTVDDLAFLHRVERADRRRAATGPARWGWLVLGWLRARTGPMMRRVAVLLALVATSSGLAVAVATPAHAAPWDAIFNWCDKKRFAPDRADNMGMLGQALQTQYEDSVKQNGVAPATKWGQYGLAGTSWDTFWMDCLDFQRYVNVAANIVFSLGKIAIAAAILIFLWTFQGDLLNIFLDQGTMGGSGATLDTMIRQTHVDVFLQLFSVAVLIGATVLAFRFLFRREAGSSMLGRIAAMILVAGVAFFYGGTPGGGGPHATAVLKTVNDWTNDITSVVLAAFAGTDCESPDLRTTDGDYNEGDAARNRRHEMALQCSAEKFYEVGIYQPWAVGLLGSYVVPPRKADNSPGDPTDTQAWALRALKYSAYSFGDVAANGNDNAKYGDQRSDVGSQNICDADVPNHDNPTTYTGKACDRSKFRNDVIGAKDSAFKEASTGWSEIRATNQTLWVNWSGGNVNNRLQVALLSVIGSTSIAVIVVVVSLTYLLLELATIILALMAPVAFLFGLIPGFGMKVLLKFLELIMGAFVKRIVLGLFVGMITALYAVVLSLAMAWLMKLILVCMIAVFGFVYRKPFSQAFSFNLGGGDAIHTQDTFGNRGLGSAVGGAMGSRARGGSALSGALFGVARGGRAGEVYDSANARAASIQARRAGRRQGRRNR